MADRLSDFYYDLLRLCIDSDSKAAQMGIEVGLPIQPEAGNELFFPDAQRVASRLRTLSH